MLGELANFLKDAMHLAALSLSGLQVCYKSLKQNYNLDNFCKIIIQHSTLNNSLQNKSSIFFVGLSTFDAQHGLHLYIHIFEQCFQIK